MMQLCRVVLFFFFQAEDGIRDYKVTGVQTCALPISLDRSPATDPTASLSVFSRLFGGFLGGQNAERDWLGNFTNYMPMFRFTLADKKIGRASCRERV